MGIILGYARVSTEDQAYKVGLSNQVERLLNAGCDRVYSDIGSRADDNREGLAKVIREVEKGEVDEIRIVALSRLTSSPTTLERLSKLVQTYKVPLTGLDENIDLSSVDGEFTALLQTAFAKREVGTIRLRSQRGHQSRRNHSRPNANVPGGYVVRDHKYWIDTRPIPEILGEDVDYSLFEGMNVGEYASECLKILSNQGSINQAVMAINRRFDLARFRPEKRKLDGDNTRTFVIENLDDLAQIREKAKVRRGLFYWAPDSLARWFRNPVLRGHTHYNTRYLVGTDSAGRRKYGGNKPISEWDIHYNTHPDQILLTDGEYQELENRIAHNAKTWAFHLVRDKNKRKPLSGLVRCGKCEGRMHSVGTKNRNGVYLGYYQCRNYAIGTCDQKKTIRSDRLEKAVIEALTQKAEQIIDSPDDLVKLPDSAELLELREQLKGLNALGNNPAIIQARQDLNIQIRNLESFEAKQNEISSTRRKEGIEVLKTVGFWESIEDPEEKGHMFQWLLDCAVVEEGEVVDVKLSF